MQVFTLFLQYLHWISTKNDSKSTSNMLLELFSFFKKNVLLQILDFFLVYFKNINKKQIYFCVKISRVHLSICVC